MEAAAAATGGTCCWGCTNPSNNSKLGPNGVQKPFVTSNGVVPAGCKRQGQGVATKLINGVAAVFFMSLERLCCMYVDTVGDSDDNDHPDQIQPLIPDDDHPLKRRREKDDDIVVEDDKN